MGTSGNFWKKCKEMAHLSQEEFDLVEELEANIALYSNEILFCEREIAKILNKEQTDLENGNEIEDHNLPF